MRRRAWRSLAAIAAVVLVVSTASAGAARTLASGYPVLDVGADAPLLNQADDLWFDAYDLDFGGDTEAVAITSATGFGVSLARAVGSRIGDAELGTVTQAGGKITRYSGSVKVIGQAAFAANPDAQACAAGTHVATWMLVLNGPSGSLNIPLAVDRAGPDYTFTMCFDPVSALNVKLSYVYFSTTNVFRNASHTGDYVFKARVTPFDATGAPDPGSVYEIRGIVPLPQLLDANPVYDTAKKTLTVSGTLREAGKIRPDTDIHVFAGLSTNPAALHEVGRTLSAANGSTSSRRGSSLDPASSTWRSCTTAIRRVSGRPRRRVGAPRTRSMGLRPTS